MSRKLWDYVCTECEHEEELFASDDEKDSQVCGVCECPMARQMANPAGWAPSQERTNAQLRQRSTDHTLNMMKRGHDPNQSDNFHQSKEWKKKNRARNTKKGMVARHQHDWKKYAAANEPKTEFISRAELAKKTGG